MPPLGSTESKVVPPGSSTHGPSIGGKGRENWKAPKTPKSHYTQAYKGEIILSLSFKWPALAVTHLDVTQTNNNAMSYITREDNDRLRRTDSFMCDASATVVNVIFR